MLKDAYKAQAAYMQLHTQTASSDETLVLLFEGTVSILHRARGAMETGDLEQQSHYIGRAQRILTELLCALDPSHDEALATSLRCTYTAMYNRLSEANMKDDVAALDEVSALAQKLAQAWRSAFESVSREAQEERAVAAG